jgi:3-methyladenine DNA glycosylase/8-oxoguanine DNA glycosylase
VSTHSVPIDRPLDLRATLRPLQGRFSDDGWWLAARTAVGPASLRITRTRDHLKGEAWGPGADTLLGRLELIGGLADDPSSFRPADGVVAELHRAHAGWRFGRTDRVFDALIVAICAQKVTGRQARAAIRGLYRRFGDPAPGPNESLRLPPDPERLAGSPYHVFHQLHLEKRRADVIRRVSAEARRIDELASLPPTAAAGALEAFNGISVWTTAKTLEVSHGDPDQVAVGDYHLKHMVVHHLTGRDRGTDEEMVELLEPYRPHRGRVIRLLHLLGHEPSFGPRVAMRDITKM